MNSGVSGSIHDLLRRIRSDVERAIVLIDGRSGSGKSELATSMNAQWPDAQLVRLDDIYPGWDGLEAASLHVEEQILGRNRWQSWNWVLDCPGDWVEVDRSRPLIVEGVGTLSSRNRALATFGIWVELDDATRSTRALARDGDLFAPHWEHWATQERDYLEREHPKSRADVIIDGRHPPR